MKIRSGFVSNSSSASFTIVWKAYPRLPITQVNVAAAIKDILAFDEPGIEEEVIKSSRELAPNVFESNFDTIMMNSFGDLGKCAQALLFALYLEQHHPTRGYGYVEIISTNLEFDP